MEKNKQAITIRLTESELKILDDLSNKTFISRSDIIKICLEIGYRTLDLTRADFSTLAIQELRRLQDLKNWSDAHHPNNPTD